MPLPTDPTAPASAALAVDQGINAANTAGMSEEEKKARQQEEDAVSASWKEYEIARKFDGPARKRYATDRAYAAGTADQCWAVNTNLIGSAIDVLVSFLYARNPDVSVRKAPQVVPSPQPPPKPDGTRLPPDSELFARTMELVISSLWKRSQLKRNGRKAVRSSLSVGPGVIKASMRSENPNEPQMLSELNTLKKNAEELEATRNELLSTQQFKSAEEQAALIEKEQELIDSLTTKMEASVRKYFAVDFVAAENFQCGADVASIGDHVFSEWNADAVYKPKSQAKTLFPDLTDDDIKGATEYFQRQMTALEPMSETESGEMIDPGSTSPDAADQFTTSAATTGAGDERGIPFIKIVEKWDNRTGFVHTMIEGVKVWAKKPYQPAYPSTRFYPYFTLALYEVDGARHPQSLSWRLRKLQDEYARTRSNLRLTRQRSIPGVLVNGHGLTPEDVSKVEQSVHQELTVLNPVEPNADMNSLFAPKPIGNYDPRIYDTTPIQQDMEKMSGVQEALQSSEKQTPITATEAQIQSSGFASRTDADRDNLEMLLGDLAIYTAEQALTCLELKDVQRICGAGAFWPTGMALDDLLTMVEIDIEAGTSGKPKANGDKEAWATVLPTLQAIIQQIVLSVQSGDLATAQALKALVRETMIRMGDDTDIDRFLPAIPDMGAMAPPVPGMPGSGPLAPPVAALPATPSGGAPGGAAPPPEVPAGTTPPA